MKNNRKSLRRLFLSLAIFFVLIIGLFVIPYFANIVMPWQKAKAISADLDWGGLANLPKQSRHISVNMKGSMFTREYIVQFDVDSIDVNDWINHSKRIKDVTPIIEKDGHIKYNVYPGENDAIGGTIRIDKQKGRVIVDMSHS